MRKEYLWRKGRGEEGIPCGGRGEMRKDYLWRKAWGEEGLPVEEGVR